MTDNRLLFSNLSPEKIFFLPHFPNTYCIQKQNVDNATARLLAIFLGSAYDDMICSWFVAAHHDKLEHKKKQKRLRSHLKTKNLN